MKQENHYEIPEYGNIVLPSLTFMLDLTMNLINEIHYECETRAPHHRLLGEPNNYYMKLIDILKYLFNHENINGDEDNP